MAHGRVTQPRRDEHQDASVILERAHPAAASEARHDRL